MRAQATFETVLSVVEMAAADAAAPGLGMPSMNLMENAGRAVADEIGKRWTPRPTAVLCGPGNNGGDGYVAARMLKARGWPVWCETIADTTALRGDAAEAFGRWDGETLPVSPDNPMAELFVDALFGAGLSRPLEGHAARLASASARFAERVVSVDVPSGIHGDTGQALGGVAFHAALAVTFVCRKPGHVLMPGRAQCGETVVADIGMPTDALPAAISTYAIAGGVAVEGDPAAHKYARGHCLVVSGGPLSAGAARLSAQAAARAGAGLVTICGSERAVMAQAAHVTSIMVRAAASGALLEDTRKNAVVIGPGLGFGPDALAELESVLAARRATVVDADAITLLVTHGTKGVHELCVLTPHGGEFARLFPDLSEALPSRGKLSVVREAAARCGAVVLLKGADTVIAAPDGRAAIDMLAPPWLATAGSGDVLTGLIGGLLAQGDAPFEAACGGVFLHGAAARALGPGLVADDLPGAIPGVLAGLKVVARRR
jgi:hydroxyethylthiazole kinase-like uncharacterized protein yjeF